MKFSQLESIWSLIFSEGTEFPQMGQETIVNQSLRTQGRDSAKERDFKEANDRFQIDGNCRNGILRV